MSAETQRLGSESQPETYQIPEVSTDGLEEVIESAVGIRRRIEEISGAISEYDMGIGAPRELFTDRNLWSARLDGVTSTLENVLPLSDGASWTQIIEAKAKGQSR